MIVQNIINILFHFLLFFGAFLIVMELFFRAVLKNNRDISGKKMQLFGMLMGLDKLTVFSLSAIMMKYLFIVFTLVDNNSIMYVHLVILLLLSVVFGVTSLSIKNVIIESISSVAIYFSIFCFKLLCNYLADVRMEWYVILGAVLIFMFIILHATFFVLKNINYLAMKTKYVRSVRYED